jgi:F420-non-reducing hydrogenase iron-sulfur subunit
MSWSPRIVVLQCQFCLYSEADQHWMETQLPEHIKLVRVPCTGRISPLFVLNAVQGGADGVLICGCLPEKCHFKEGNLGARRQLDEFGRFLNYLGMEPERLRFAWIDLDERGTIQRELADLEAQISAIGPARRLVTRPPSGAGAML